MHQIINIVSKMGREVWACLGEAATTFRLIADKRTLAGVEATVVVQIGDLREGLAAVHALVGPVVGVDAFVVPQIGRLREACKEVSLIKLIWVEMNENPPLWQ